MTPDQVKEADEGLFRLDMLKSALQSMESRGHFSITAVPKGDFDRGQPDALRVSAGKTLDGTLAVSDQAIRSEIQKVVRDLYDKEIAALKTRLRGLGVEFPNKSAVAQ